MDAGLEGTQTQQAQQVFLNTPITGQQLVVGEQQNMMCQIMKQLMSQMMRNMNIQYENPQKV